MRRLSLFLILGLVIISLVGCGEAKILEKTSPDGNKVTVGATGNVKEIMMEDIESKLLDGYVQVTAEEVKKSPVMTLLPPSIYRNAFNTTEYLCGITQGYRLKRW